MAKRPTIVDVARLSRVSQGTVSRVLNGAAGVSRATRLRVEDAAESLGYSLNQSARTMRGGATHTISCHVSDLSNPVIVEIFYSIEEHLLLSGYTLIVHGTEYDEEKELSALRLDVARSVDAIITIGGPLDHQRYQEALYSLKIPVIGIDRGDQHYDRITVDHRNGAARIVRHLASLGHSRIGLMVPPINLCAPSNRLEGYKDGLKAVGLEYDPTLVFVGPDTDSLVGRLEANMAAGRGPTAMIVLSIRQLAVTLGRLKQLGIRVPGDMSIVTVGKSQLASLYTPEISILEWDLSALGSMAADLALKRVTGDPATKPVCHTFPTSFKQGGSCRASSAYTGELMS